MFECSSFGSLNRVNDWSGLQIRSNSPCQQVKNPHIKEERLATFCIFVIAQLPGKGPTTGFQKE
jgi:hypothetical protein